MDRITNLREKRVGLIEKARKITERAESEARDLNTEERSEFDKVLADAEGVRGDIERAEKLAAAEGDLGKRSAEPVRPEVPESAIERMEARGWDVKSLREQHGEARMASYREAAKSSHKQYATEPYRAAFRDWLRTGEQRALQVDIGASGGFTVAPVQFQSELIQAADNQTFVRELGTVITVSGAQALGLASLDADPDDADWTSELAIGSADSTMAFGQRQLHPHPLAKSIKVSKTLLRLNPAIESLVTQRLAYKFAVSAEKAGLTGTGAMRPLGLLTASNDGISTGRDVSTGNTTTSITFDGLASAKGTLKSAYQMSPTTRWLFHRDAITQLLKLKDGNDQYIWRESVRAGEPPTIFGVPVLMSEYVSNTFTTGLYVGLIGDLRFYWWADALGMTIERLNELYAATNQVGFVGRLESDGMPVLEEAFVRVKLA